MEYRGVQTEKELLLRIADGDVQAFTALYETCYDRVYGTALLVSKSPELASDIAQDVFVGLWNNKAKLREIQQLSSYLFVTTRNLIYNKMKRWDVEAAYTSYLQLNTEQPELIERIPESLRLKELKTLLEQGIRQLPPQQQRAFRLSREQELSHAEIAREMGVSAGTVKDYIVRALAFLRSYLKGKGGVFLLITYWISHK